MKVSEHLKNFHEASADHQDGLEKSSRKMAALHHELHKASGLGEDADGPHARLASEHEKRADLHKAHGEHHRSAMEACEKAMAGDLEKGSRIIPDRVSRIPDRDVPPEGFGGYRAVVRAGQPEVFAKVDPQLRSILGPLDGSDDA